MIKKSVYIIIVVLIAMFLFSCSEDEIPEPDFIKEGEYFGTYSPTTEWRECTPEKVGMNSKKLKAVYDYCASSKRKTFSFIIIKDGYIVAESYLNDSTINSKIPSYSLAKSFTAALTGIAIQKGYLNSIEDKIVDYFPQLSEEGVDHQRREIKIKHLLTMTSGFQWNETQISFTNNDLYKIKTHSDYIKYIFEKPMVETPGTVWNYSSGNPLLLGGVIENATEMLTFDFAKQTLFADLGITDVEWESDKAGHTIAAWALKLKTRDYAKLGYLYWQNGVWDNKQILPEYWVTDTQKPALEGIPYYGYLFWRAYRYPDHIGIQIPEDAYMATGLFHKYVIILPSHNLILVRMGEDVIEGEHGWDAAEFISLSIDAIDN